MSTSLLSTVGPLLLIWLLVCIVVIIFLSAKIKLHPFLSIVAATYIFGLGANAIGKIVGTSKPLIADIGGTMTTGFGNILASIGMVIIFGTIIGKFIERSGAAITMAETVLKYIKNSALAMSIIGWVVSIPVFCDSGYVILSSLKKSVAKKANVNIVVLSVSLATGLYASHTFVPPTPGPIAAAGNLGINASELIWVIIVGAFVSIFTALAGYIYASKFTKNLTTDVEEAIESFEDYKKKFTRLPSAFQSFTPILLPVVLMALGSIANFPVSGVGTDHTQTLFSGWLYTVVNFIGQPVNALFIGVVSAFFLLLPEKSETTLTKWVADGLLDSAIIIMITGAGAAFGAMIQATPIADYIKSLLEGNTVFVGAGALFLLFIISALLKTAQGSSTAALIITSTIVMPLLPSLGLDAMIGNIPIGQVLAVMAIGSGAMVVSHVNDSYFWVVTQFSNMKLTTAYRAQTVATLIQGLVGIIITFILGVIFL
ncbi:gluconate transporter [Pullulanibacillus camelliae]|uniref:Gluconate transporter n=1 Tax=Pullulanibacillus camelliae TaxID=1707096 RepID=A0A8J2VLW3_9BACL|nr:GntP family permease [Pullulanibacillus camelliae]GGE27875.1 gluconate transporter [Pullulanibacillus camelliae]